MALFCPMGSGKNFFTLHKSTGRRFFNGRITGKSKRIQGSEDSHSQSSSQPSEPRDDHEKCEKLDYVMKWNADVITGLEKSASLESFTNSSGSRTSSRSVESLCCSNSLGSGTSLDSLSKSDENLANWKGRKVYNSVRKSHSMENLRRHSNTGKDLIKPTENLRNSQTGKVLTKPVENLRHSQTGKDLNKPVENSQHSQTRKDLNKPMGNIRHSQTGKEFTKPVENAQHLNTTGKELTKPELDSLLAGFSCGKCTSVRVKLLWNFEPINKRELRVYKGEIVNVLYKEKEWLFAEKGNGKQGYIPYNYCTLVRKSDICNERKANEVISKKVNHRSNDQIYSLLRSCSAESIMEKYSQERHSEESLNENYDTELLIPKRVQAKRFVPSETVCSETLQSKTSSGRHSGYSRKSSDRHTDSSERSRKSSDYHRRFKDSVSHQFRKTNCDIVRVLYDFSALDENDLTVKKNDLLQVLNKEDQDWWWVKKESGLEGFVPQNYVQSVHKRTLLKVPGVLRIRKKRPMV